MFPIVLDAMWMTALGFALPVIGIGADVGDLQRSGLHALPPAGCSFTPAWHRLHDVRWFVGGFSSVDSGEVHIAVVTADDAVEAVFVTSSGVLGSMYAVDQCTTHDSESTNALGVDVESRSCSAHAFVERRAHEQDDVDAIELASCEAVRQWRALAFASSYVWTSPRASF